MLARKNTWSDLSSRWWGGLGEGGGQAVDVGEGGGLGPLEQAGQQVDRPELVGVHGVGGQDAGRPYEQGDAHARLVQEGAVVVPVVVVAQVVAVVGGEDDDGVARAVVVVEPLEQAAHLVVVVVDFSPVEADGLLVLAGFEGVGKDEVALAPLGVVDVVDPVLGGLAGRAVGPVGVEVVHVEVEGLLVGGLVEPGERAVGGDAGVGVGVERPDGPEEGGVERGDHAGVAQRAPGPLELVEAPELFKALAEASPAPHPGVADHRLGAPPGGRQVLGEGGLLGPRPSLRERTPLRVG